MFAKQAANAVAWLGGFGTAYILPSHPTAAWWFIGVWCVCTAAGFVLAFFFKEKTRA